MSENEIGDAVIAAAMRVHTALGPGLLESVYEACLAHELTKHGMSVKRQVVVPMHYDGLELESGLRLDLLVNDRVVVELKCVDRFAPIHTAQLLSYLKLSKCRLGYLLNFNDVHLREGIKRLVNGL